MSAGAAAIGGRIHDASGHPLKDVAVTAENSPKVFSAADGEFSLQPAAAAGKVTVLFEAPGYYAETVVCDVEGQPAPLDVTLTPQGVVREQVKVVASRLNISLALIPAATSVVGPQSLDAMPRGIAIDEPLASVPGVKVDNQANGERVHLSIRGQGILSERGIRGIQVLYDGIPLNDPSGFCPDVFDVDWLGVQEVNVVRGPVAFLYGGGSAGGVIDIRTRAADFSPLHGGVWTEGGSNGFYKTRGEASGTGKGVSYLISGSRTAGDGYREHTAYWGNNIYGRLGFNPVRRLRLNPFVIGTGFFSQNAEGLNLNWGYPSANWWTMANPDSLTYNEYQLTHRVLGGITGQFEATENQRLSFTFYARHTGYTESVPSSVAHRGLNAPGGSAQYEVESGAGTVRNHLSIGLDLDSQFITDRPRANMGNAVDGAVVADQSVTQRRTGGFITDRISVGQRLTLLAGLRFDRISNELTDRFRANGLDLSGSQNFKHATGRLGATWNLGKNTGIYASWGQGFMPPATEELYANPAALGGFNKSLVPAKSKGEELGVRSGVAGRVFWDVAFFHLATSNDFERYRITSRPLETFYGNAGESRRYGLESSVRWLPTPRVTVTAAHTYSNFTYTRYSSLTYAGNLTGNDLPNSPRQQFYADASFEIVKTWVIGASTGGYSRAYIDPTNKTSIDAYGLLNARLSKSWHRRGAYGTFFVAGKNLTGKQYIAFTEPDPDGSSYQPGSNREVFCGVQVRF